MSAPLHSSSSLSFLTKFFNFLLSLFLVNQVFLPSQCRVLYIRHSLSVFFYHYLSLFSLCFCLLLSISVFSLALFDTLTHPFLTNICLSFFLKVRGCLSFHLFLDIIPLPMFSLTLFVCVCVFVLVHSFSFRSHRTVV